MKMEHMEAPKLFQFYAKISDTSTLLSYMRDLNLLDSKRNCHKCKEEMKLSKNRSKADGEEWRCGSCLITESVRKYSYFEVKV